MFFRRQHEPLAAGYQAQNDKDRPILWYSEMDSDGYWVCKIAMDLETGEEPVICNTKLMGIKGSNSDTNKGTYYGDDLWVKHK